MDLKRLSFFLKLAETLHFGRAAEELGIAQSALSRQILILEEELGCRLFDRSNRWKVSLTPSGAAFAPEVRKILDLAGKAKDVALAAAKGELGRLSVELVPSVMSFPPFLHAVHEMRIHHPGLHLNIQESSSSRIYGRVCGKETDLGILRIASVPDEELEMRLLARNRLLMAIPEKHPLAEKKRLFLRDFSRERFVVPRATDAALPGNLLDLVCRKAGFTPEIALETESMTAVLSILAALNCVTLVPDSFAGRFGGLVFRSLDDYAEMLPLSAVWRRDNPSPALKKFLRILEGAPRVSGGSCGHVRHVPAQGSSTLMKSIMNHPQV